MSKQWYVRHEGTGEISGPMTKDEVLDKADDVEGMVFSDEIFETHHVPEDVTALINELVDGIENAPPTPLIDLGKRAAHKLVLLSRPLEVTATVRSGVFEVETIEEGVHLVVIDYDIEGDTQAVDYDQDEEGVDCIIQEYGP